jgi:hypothetical protein
MIGKFQRKLQLGNISFIIHMQKLCSHKVLNTFAPQTNMGEQPCSPNDQMCPELCMNITFVCEF